MRVPCAPPPYLHDAIHSPSIHTKQVAFALLDKYIPPVAKLLWSEAFNLRVGTQVTAVLCEALKTTGDVYILTCIPSSPY